MPIISGARICATALEREPVRAAVGLWQLFFETGRWRGDFLAEPRTASGRKQPWGMLAATRHWSLLTLRLDRQLPRSGAAGAFRPGAVVQASRKSRRQWLVTRYSRRTLTSARRGEISKAVAQELCRASRHRRLVERLQVRGANWRCRPSAADDRGGVGVGDAAESGRSPRGRFREPEPEDRVPVSARSCGPAIDPLQPFSRPDSTTGVRTSRPSAHQMPTVAAGPAWRRRHAAGGMPYSRRNARLNAVSVW